MNLRSVAAELVRSFENHGKTTSPRIGNDTGEALEPKVSQAETLVPILMRPERILGVIEVERTKPVDSQHAIELVQDGIKVARDVIATIAHVACVEAHTDKLVMVDAIYDSRQFLEGLSDLGLFASHGLEEGRSCVARVRGKS